MKHASMIDQARCEILACEDKRVLLVLGMGEKEYEASMSRKPKICPTCGDTVCNSCGSHLRGVCPTALIEAVMET